MKALVNRKFLEYKKRSYAELKKLIESPECDVEDLDGKSYSLKSLQN